MNYKLITFIAMVFMMLLSGVFAYLEKITFGEMWISILLCNVIIQLIIHNRTYEEHKP